MTTHHEGTHHLVVLMHGVVAVHHVLAQMRAVARRDDDLSNVCSNVHSLRQVSSQNSGGFFLLFYEIMFFCFYTHFIVQTPTNVGSQCKSRAEVQPMRLATT
jgi:hypothetical protein